MKEIAAIVRHFVKFLTDVNLQHEMTSSKKELVIALLRYSWIAKLKNNCEKR